jgi:hypothetical protein
MLGGLVFRGLWSELLMNERILELTRSLTRKPGASATTIRETLAALGVTPPEDYVEFLLDSNGAEGFMPSGRYLMLDPVEYLVACNEPYGLGESGPGLVAFGSDGATMLYAFDIRESPVKIVEVDAVSMDLGPVIAHGRTFLEFLEDLARVE